MIPIEKNSASDVSLGANRDGKVNPFHVDPAKRAFMIHRQSPSLCEPSRKLRRIYQLGIGMIVGSVTLGHFLIPWATHDQIAPGLIIFPLTMIALLAHVVLVFEPTVDAIQSQFRELQAMLNTVQKISVTPKHNRNQVNEVAAVSAYATGLTSEPHCGDTADSPRILLVEDNHINQLLAQEVLSGHGWRCDTATNGGEALKVVETVPYDLILMDCQMPIMDGFSLTEKIRQMQIDGSLDRRCPIIAVTANALQGDRQKCIDAGMDDYLAKPFSPKQLINMVQHWLPAGTPCDPIEAEAIGAVSEPLDPFDQQEFVERCMGDLAFAESLLESFASDSCARLQEIQVAASECNAAGVGDAAHTLKGMAGILAAHPLQSIAGEIEQAGRADNLNGVVELIDELRAEVDRCLAYIPKMTQAM